MIEDVVRPRGPYRLHLMTYRRPTFETPLPGGRRGQAWQRSDGLVVLRAPDEESLALLRFMLALDSDTTEFTQRFRHDPLLGPSIRSLHGLRPLRRPTVAHAVLRAVCGQLIEARRALAIERAIVRACGEPAPSRQAIGALSPAELRRLGLATQRASTLVRVCRTLDLEGATRTSDRSGGGTAPARARPRPVVARGDRARRPRQLPPRARRRPRPRQALLRAPGPLGRAARDRRAARSVRGMGRARGRLSDEGLERGARSRRAQTRTTRALPRLVRCRAA